MTKSKRHLGVVMETSKFKQQYMELSIKAENKKLLASIAKSEPQCAYAAMM